MRVQDPTSFIFMPFWQKSAFRWDTYHPQEWSCVSQHALGGVSAHGGGVCPRGVSQHA